MHLQYNYIVYLVKLALMCLLLFLLLLLLQEWCKWPAQTFEEMDSTVVVQQYIQQLIKTETFNIDLILTPPEGQDEGVWKYEHLR